MTMYNAERAVFQEPHVNSPCLISGISTGCRPLERIGALSCVLIGMMRSDLLFEGGSWESFHHRLCWLCCDFHIFAKDVANAGFCGWLHTSLDAAESWNCEDAVLLHLTGSNGSKGVKNFRALLLLQLKLLRESLCHRTFGHGLGAALHACCLHCLHCLHDFLCHLVDERRMEVQQVN